MTFQEGCLFAGVTIVCILAGLGLANVIDSVLKRFPRRDRNNPYGG